MWYDVRCWLQSKYGAYPSCQVRFEWVDDKLITNTEHFDIFVHLISSNLFPHIAEWSVFSWSTPEDEEDDSETFPEKMEVTCFINNI